METAKVLATFNTDSGTAIPGATVVFTNGKSRQPVTFAETPNSTYTFTSNSQGEIVGQLPKPRAAAYPAADYEWTVTVTATGIPARVFQKLVFGSQKIVDLGDFIRPTASAGGGSVDLEDVVGLEDELATKMPKPSGTAAVGMVPAVSAVDGGGAATEFSLLAAAILDGVPKVAKANGDGRAGLLDWQNDDATGYLLHLRTGPNTGGDAAAIGIGTDYGAGSGLLVSHKNSGSGLRFIQNPGAGAGVYMSGMATNPVMWADIFAGSGGVSLNVKTGQGFADGVTTAGSTTLTSATAAFTAGDVGQAIAQVTSRGSGDPLGSIPANATIVAVVNSTTVTLSAAAPTSGTGIRFRVYGREPSDLQNVLRVFDTDGTTVLGVINRSQLDWRAGSVARAAIKARGKAGQTAGIVEVVDSANTILSRIGPNGHYMTRKTSAPADSELVSGEMAFWLDSTNGAAKLMVKAKEAGGTVRTAAVALA